MGADSGSVEQSALSWGPVAALAVAVAYALAQLLPEVGSAAALSGYRWVTCANTAIAGAAGIYLAHHWLRIEPVGKAASILAGIGAIGVPLGLLADAAQGAPLGSSGAEFGLYEGTALFSAAAVFLCLVMEQVYRSRAAALLILPAFLLAVLCEMWLISQGVAAPGRPAPAITEYWGLAQRFAACLGWGALAAAGACGAWILLRDASGAASPQAEAIIGAAAIGAPLLLIGTGMGAVWSIAGGSNAGAGGPGLTLPAMLAALALLAWVRWRSPSPRHLAWVAVVAVAVSATGLLTGSLTGEILN